MAKPKPKTEYREGTLGWWLVEAGWEPIHVDGELYPLWRLDGFEKLLTGWEAWRLELLHIHHEFKAKRTA